MEMSGDFGAKERCWVGGVCLGGGVCRCGSQGLGGYGWRKVVIDTSRFENCE